MSNSPEATTEKSTDLAGQEYWRSFEEYAGSPEVIEAISQEFPNYSPDEIRSMSRRQFMQLAGASMALAGLTMTGCRRWPEELVVPYAKRPVDSIPGVPEHFASMMELDGVAHPLLVASFDGRPIKIEGNPEHPLSKGASSAYAQAGTLEMYDPERSRFVVKGGKRSSWAAFETWVNSHRDEIFAEDGAKFAVLAEASASPTLAALRAELPSKSQWFTFEPAGRGNEAAGGALAFGKAVRANYDLSKAKIIASFDSDLLGAHADQLNISRGWAAGRISAESGKMNRLYAAEPGFSVTGSNADVRVAVKASKIPTLVEALAHELGVGGKAANLNGSTGFIKNLVSDLKANQGASVVTVGADYAPEVHALVWAINQKLGNLDHTITAIEEPVEQDGGIAAAVAALNAGEIETLVILGGNPVYNAPADLAFADALGKAKHSIHLSLYADETSKAAEWHLNRAHYLEAWGDGRAYDGSVCIQQPIIYPLYDGKSPIELIATLLGKDQKGGYDLVRATTNAGDNKAWRAIVHDGFVPNSASKAASVGTAKTPAIRAAQGGKDFEVSFRTGPIYDGRYANNAWLQELPEALTKLTWDNPAIIGLDDAKKLKLDNGDRIELKVNGKSVKLPVYIAPGQAAGSIILWLGYGRTAAGSVGGKAETATVGTDIYPIRTTAAPCFAAASVTKIKGNEMLASTTNHFILDKVAEKGVRKRIGEKGESGMIVKDASLKEYKSNPYFAQGGLHGDVSLQLFTPPAASTPSGKWPEKAHDDAPEVFNDPHAWGMVLDMNTCTGCNTCVIACQAENNIPSVGKTQVLMSREMHWLRIDRYFKPVVDGKKPDWSNPDVVHMPMTCVQCENAPCEQVCPVAATVHDSEGLNTMVYNRCIGTRYCSNNCPYKVRRFNYFDYHARPANGMTKPWLNIPDLEQEANIDRIGRMVYNPDVTVRMRGVMEKCTFCTQRIKRATINARNEHFKTREGVAGYDRQEPTVRDGEIVTACEQACPTNAIVFGDLNDPESRVSKMQKSNRAYTVLAELNTRARAKHMAKIRNPVV